MRLIVYFVVLSLSFFAMSGLGFAGSAMHVKIAKGHCNEMILAGEKGLDSGSQGDEDLAVKHFKKMIHEAKECVVHGQGGMNAPDVSQATQMHGPEAMEHIKEAISHATTSVKHGELGHLDILMDHGKSALVHATEGDNHARKMN